MCPKHTNNFKKSILNVFSTIFHEIMYIDFTSMYIYVGTILRNKIRGKKSDKII